MFNGNLKEAQEQAANLQEGDGVSVKSFELFLRWLYTGQLELHLKLPSRRILAAIELSRVGNTWLVPEVEEFAAQYIKRTILENLAWDTCSNLDNIETEHIASAS